MLLVLNDMSEVLLLSTCFLLDFIVDITHLGALEVQKVG